ncbi:MurR/RpiR family transcriptional regulator [Streptomyces sp. NPDC047022]|uniref:MurR/RpiR family transcriptional regulator n=1 Tax=Streptomyces sp. NPDC047022 TaxID=3155737 RepID=UPI0033D07827
MEQNSPIESTSTDARAVDVQNLAAHVRARLPQLRDAEARVAQVLLDQGPELVRLSVSDVAAMARTAPSSVIRACQRLGFRGYQEVKITAAREAPRPTTPEGADPTSRALADTVQAAREALDGLSTTVSPYHLRTAAEALHSASRILVIGAGLSTAVATDAAYRLRALGCAVDAPTDPLTAEVAASSLPADAVCLAVSHTGATRTTVDAARRAHARRATVISLTSYARSPLTETSQCTLLAGGQDLTLGLEAVAGRLAHLVVVDALALTLLALRGSHAQQALARSAEVTAAHAY